MPGLGETVGALTAFLIVFGFLTVIFFIFRGLVLWYFKIDKIVENQQRTNELLAVIADRLRPLRSPSEKR